MNEKEEKAYNTAIEKLGINPEYQSLIIARLQMEIDDICVELASLFGCPCNFSPPDEIMLESEYCEDCCGTLQDVECWKRYFHVIMENKKRNEVD